MIFPDSEKNRVVFASRAEEILYDACVSLSDSWSCYYSCTLSSFEDSKGLQSNEIDFVLYHKNWGVFVIEVKGGQIKYDASEGRFFSISRHGRIFPIKNPFQQSLVWKSRFLRFLKKKGIKVPATHLVCFPTVLESDIEQTAEVEPKLVIGKSRLEGLDRYLESLVKQVHPEKYLDFDDVGKELDQVLRGSNYSTRLYIRDYLDTHETRVRDVEIIHETLVTPVASSRRLAVEGEAGTGKTMLAIMLAKNFLIQEKSILFLSTNPFLNDYLRKELGTGVDIMTYAELASTYGVELLRRPNSFDGTREDWIQYVGPEKLKEEIAKSTKRFDVLLCDEAQDVQPFWWESIETVLSEGDSRFYIFFDRSQGVFGSGSAETSFIPEDVLPIPSPYFPLVNNYRVTREISGFSRAFRTGKDILPSHSGRIGYFPDIISYENEVDARKKLSELLSRLRKDEGLRAHEITILSGRRPFQEGSILHGHRVLDSHKLQDLGTKKTSKSLERDNDSIAVSTIASFKGLETSVGIILNMSEYNLPISNPIMASLFYVACTRAKHLLFLMVKKDSDKHEALNRALEDIDPRGRLVVDKSLVTGEISGEVSSYNPKRFGWIQVSDAAFEQGNIMFFPSDVEKAGLSNIKKGVRLTFTPRIDCETLIATDLKKT